MEDFLRRYWAAVLVVAIGGAAMIVLGFLQDNTTALMWIGGIAGVALGIAIAAASGDEDNPGKGRDRRRRP